MTYTPFNLGRAWIIQNEKCQTANKHDKILGVLCDWENFVSLHLQTAREWFAEKAHFRLVLDDEKLDTSHKSKAKRIKRNGAPVGYYSTFE